MREQSIVYVNFSPYDNAGRILDFLVDNFSLVIHFSYDHLRLKNGRRTNLLTVYSHGRIMERHKLIPLRTPEILRFPSLPLVAMLIFLQTWWHCFRYKKRFKMFNYFFTVNAYTAWFGNILKKTGLVKKTIFWVWDYYPPRYPDWRIQFLRWVYWKFDRPAIFGADRLAFISDKLLQLRHDFSSLPKKKKYQIIPIGTNPMTETPVERGRTIGFLGMLKQSQGLDLLFDALPKLRQRFPDLSVEIIGSGPEEPHFKARGRKWGEVVKFLGYIESEEEVDKLMRHWSVGLATYLPVSSNESYWTDPSKIKTYLSQAVPVVTTAVPYLAREIKRFKAGVVINYNQNELVTAIVTIFAKRKNFAKSALSLARRYEYRRLYQKFFKRG